jgi:aspartyl-tRNA synthetase
MAMDFTTALAKYRFAKSDMRIQLDFINLTDLMSAVNFKCFSTANP